MLVSALALSACTSDEGDDANNDDNNASNTGAESGAESETEETDAGIEIEGAPAGFKATEPGTRLALGEPAQVVTANQSGLQYWELTVNEPVDHSTAGIEGKMGVTPELQVAEDDNEISALTCVPYTFTYLGSGPLRPDSTEESAPEGTNTDSLREPDLTATDASGSPANDFPTESSDVAAICDFHDSEILTPGTHVDEVEAGTEYKGAVVSFRTTDPNDPGIEATGAKLDYNYLMESVGQLDGGTIYWN